MKEAGKFENLSVLSWFYFRAFSFKLNSEEISVKKYFCYNNSDIVALHFEL